MNNSIEIYENDDVIVQCTECKNLKSITEFDKDRTKKCGHRYKCKACVKSKNHQYYITHKSKWEKYYTKQPKVKTNQ